MKRLILAVLSLAAALSLFAAPCFAIPLATTTLSCDDDVVINRFNRIGCGQIVDRPENRFRFEERAAVSITGGIPPILTASANALAQTFAGLPGGETNSDADIDAIAVGTFSAQISETSRPPFRPDIFPIIIFIEGALEVSVLPGPFGRGEAFAGALVQARGAFVIDAPFELPLVTDDFLSMPILLALQRNCFTDCAVEFTKAAGVEVFASVLAPSNLSASSGARAAARIDPFLAFDQDTFDQTHGANSFLLEDFYAFTFSPNLTVTAPEPATLLLMGLGLAGLGIARWRKRNG